MQSNSYAYVNVSCANLYREASFHCEIDSQVILWEELTVLETQNDFVKVITEDGYTGWVNSYQIKKTDKVNKSAFKIVTQSLVVFHKEATESSPIVRDGAAGVSIPVVAEKDGWLETRFPDNQNGCIKKESTLPLPKLSRQNLVNYALSFLGVTYIWGGKTPRGFDCSGYTQFIHNMFGIKLRRDAGMQFEDATFISKNPLDGQPGDLFFFAESGEKITHVGFCLGQGKTLHTQGMTRINSLVEDDRLFNRRLLENFVEIRTFI